MNKKKVSSPMAFPDVLDMSQYTTRGGAAAQEGGGAPADGGGGDGSQRYRLTAVLMHTGASAHSGHYTARIMEQPSGEGPDACNGGAPPAAAAEAPSAEAVDGARWWTFNDETVTLEDWKTEKQAASAGVATVAAVAPGLGASPPAGRWWCVEVIPVTDMSKKMPSPRSGVPSRYFFSLGSDSNCCHAFTRCL